MRLIDADKLFESLRKTRGYGLKMGFSAECVADAMLDVLTDFTPTVDVVPVRCKDCIHVCDYTDIYPKSEGYKCIKNGRFHDENWYCADGERRGGERYAVN